jgi:hypothetical protein
VPSAHLPALPLIRNSARRHLVVRGFTPISLMTTFVLLGTASECVAFEGHPNSLKTRPSRHRSPHRSLMPGVITRCLKAHPTAWNVECASITAPCCSAEQGHRLGPITCMYLVYRAAQAGAESIDTKNFEAAYFWRCAFEFILCGPLLVSTSKGLELSSDIRGKEWPNPAGPRRQDSSCNGRKRQIPRINRRTYEKTELTSKPIINGGRKLLVAKAVPRPHARVRTIF